MEGAIWWLILIWVCLGLQSLITADGEGPRYDSTAYTECKSHPESPLYNGGILKDANRATEMIYHVTETGVFSPAIVLENLTESTRYTFSCWVKIRGTAPSLVRARLSLDNSTLNCIGTALATNDCWSFLKGGFVLDSFSKTSVLFFQSFDKGTVEISIASASLQPFTVEQWSMQQEENIKAVLRWIFGTALYESLLLLFSSFRLKCLTSWALYVQRRKRMVAVHVSDLQGIRVSGASISVQQLSKDFPFGSAIAKTILGNSKYQTWFVERFNAAVFENELKWYTTEPKRGQLNYTLADQMLEFTRANQILVRGHNIFWEDPKYNPSWVRNLTGDDFRSAVTSRIHSLLTRYKGDFVHWDVSNEMLHFDFYEQRLGPNATLQFFDSVKQSDPLATLFLNDFNVVETCDDVNSTVDSYVARLQELRAGGGAMLEGIGLEGHFSKPNIPLMRAVIDKLATLQLPVWLTEIDISKTFDPQMQAVYLEEVLREGFSHPAVDGIMLWTALHPNGCYEMCLTNNDLLNLPAGDVVDRLLKEWETREVAGSTDDHGLYSVGAFLGEYKVSVQYENRTVEAALSLSRGDETMHLNIQV